MCGRYTNQAELNQIRLSLGIDQLELFREWRPTYNIAPSYGRGSEQLIAIRNPRSQIALRLARWWLIPPFHQGALNRLPTSFNARAEDIEHKPFFREAFRHTRCLVPATGWREFTGPSGHKQPYHFAVESGLFTFAGLWSTWTSPEGEVIDSFAIITTEPNAIARPIHDRMPLLMPDASRSAWLDPSSDPVALLADACARNQELKLEVYASDPIGNDSRFEGPTVLARASGAKAPEQLSLFRRNESG